MQMHATSYIQTNKIYRSVGTKLNSETSIYSWELFSKKEKYSLIGLRIEPYEISVPKFGM